METVVLVQMLTQLLPTLINILMHYEDLIKNGTPEDREKAKVYLDSLKWKSWNDLKKEVEASSIKGN